MRPFGQLSPFQRFKGRLRHRIWRELPELPPMFRLRDVVIAVILIVAICWAHQALSHSWYEPDCCSGDDCKPVSPEDLIEVEDGWKYLPTGYVFKGKQIRPSRDRHFHVCITKSGTHYCVYILQGT